MAYLLYSDVTTGTLTLKSFSPDAEKLSVPAGLMPEGIKAGMGAKIGTILSDLPWWVWVLVAIGVLSCCGVFCLCAGVLYTFCCKSCCESFWACVCPCCCHKKDTAKSGSGTPDLGKPVSGTEIERAMQGTQQSPTY